jgi:hypothetical protein
MLGIPTTAFAESFSLMARHSTIYIAGAVAAIL